MVVSSLCNKKISHLENLNLINFIWSQRVIPKDIKHSLNPKSKGNAQVHKQAQLIIKHC